MLHNFALQRRGPQRSIDVIVSAVFIITILLLSFVCLELIKVSIFFLYFPCISVFSFTYNDVNLYFRISKVYTHDTTLKHYSGVPRSAYLYYDL